MTVFIVTENEDTVPSEESSKSKSSQEEKNVQGQKQRGEQIIQHSFKSQNKCGKVDSYGRQRHSLHLQTF